MSKVILQHTVVITAIAIFVSSGAASAQSTFSDVPDNHWAAAAVKTLVQAGIIEGYGAAPQKKEVAVDNSAETLNRVRRALLREKKLDLRYINVAASAGKTVVLSGTVFSSLDRDIAGQVAAHNAEGYKIINRLKVGARPFSR